ncbi:hypothetical protein GCM10025867_47900 (plasmid) [Frondihabitans sucicola]|uniref:Uncharacterized protein n=1 Tax=Frondihabitans sucicola TaxID=1268041 RepID=A0ABN6Y5I1_9MICO|nr:hypothetical protein [Frondihabitans sucicola]BDZ52549.1 hypothetical protein GCM10025867_47900 [Frondihabitans sucicola]
MSDDARSRAERDVAAMSEDERAALLHTSDGYYVLDRYNDTTEDRRVFYKVIGIDQWKLVDGSWQPLGSAGTYKNEPLWWLWTGDTDFHAISETDLPNGAPL